MRCFILRAVLKQQCATWYISFLMNGKEACGEKSAQ